MVGADQHASRTENTPGEAGNARRLDGALENQQTRRGGGQGGVEIREASALGVGGGGAPAVDESAGDSPIGSGTGGGSGSEIKASVAASTRPSGALS